MSSFLKNLSDEIWDKDWWLPKGSNWSEIRKYTGIDLQQYISVCSAFAVFIYLVRIVFERFLAKPLGRHLNVPDKELFEHNPKLELYYKEKDQVLTDSVVRMLVAETGLKSDAIKSWFANRKNLDKKSQLEKFSEASWRFTFYFAIWIYGLYVISDKEWISDTNHHWISYPRQYMTSDVYYYYTLEISFYLSLLVSQFFDVKRKDFWQMFLHHIVTLSLLIFSLMCNFQRVGTFVLVLHDTADSSLELAKMGQYCKFKWLSDPMFALFALIWFVTRLVIYPAKILNSTLFEAPAHFGYFPAFHFFNGLLCTLQAMHVIWFYMIMRVAVKAFSGKDQLRDDRSESEDSTGEKHSKKE